MTEPLAIQGEMIMAVERSPRRRKSNGPRALAAPAQLVLAMPGWSLMLHAASSFGTPSCGGTMWSSEMVILFGLARRTARKSRKHHYFTEASGIVISYQKQGLFPLGARADSLIYVL